jgi:hypothetical protein
VAVKIGRAWPDPIPSFGKEQKKNSDQIWKEGEAVRRSAAILA